MFDNENRECFLCGEKPYEELYPRPLYYVEENTYICVDCVKYVIEKAIREKKRGGTNVE